MISLGDGSTRLAARVVDVVVLAPAPEGAASPWQVLTVRRAAGVRCTGAWEVVHGRIEPGEAPPAAARREVLEETGHTCRLGTELPQSRYTDAQGRPKEVHYWAAEATGGAFEPNEEVSDLVWLTPDEAREQLTHERDRDLVPAALIAIGMYNGPRGL